MKLQDQHQNQNNSVGIKEHTLQLPFVVSSPLQRIPLTKHNTTEEIRKDRSNSVPSPVNQQPSSQYTTAAIERHILTHAS